MQTENDSGIVKSKRAVSREPIDCKYIQVTDPNTKKALYEICKTPSEGSHYTFWYKPSNEDCGLTIKLIAKPTRGKSNSSDIIWKCTWVYNKEKHIFYSSLASRSLLTDPTIEGEDADKLFATYELYRKA
jgi:hypothetical protein